MLEAGVKDVTGRNAADKTARICQFEPVRELLDEHRAGEAQVQMAQCIEQGFA